MKTHTRRALLAAVGLATLVVIAVALWWHFSLHGFEAELKAAVSHPDCRSVVTNDHGLYGPELASLRREASHRFGTWCNDVGPDAAWYRYPSSAAFRRALRGLRIDRFTGVCVSWQRREVILAGGVPKFAALCRERDGRIIQRGDQSL